MKRLFLAFLFLLTAILPVQSLEDFWQRPLKIQRPQRIISLSPATTEMIYAIGAEAKLVGVTHDCNYPKAAQSKARVGKFGEVQLEKILKLKPDLILATTEMKQVLAPLKRLKIPVLALNMPSAESIEKQLLVLGQLTQKTGQAQARIKQMQTAQKQLKHWPIAQSPAVFYLVWDRPLMSASQSSFIGSLIQKSGGKNIVQSKTPFLHYSLESLLKNNPQVLVIPESVAKRIHLDKAPFNQLQAVKQKKVLIINDDLISRPGPRVVEAMHLMNQFFESAKK